MSHAVITRKNWKREEVPAVLTIEGIQAKHGVTVTLYRYGHGYVAEIHGMKYKPYMQQALDMFEAEYASDYSFKDKYQVELSQDSNKAIIAAPSCSVIEMVLRQAFKAYSKSIQAAPK